MPATAPPRYLTANDLLTGRVVYLATDGRWVPTLAQAELVADADENAARLARAEVDVARVVGPYLADATTDAGLVRFREQVRAAGPSNHAHGNQERVRHV